MRNGKLQLLFVMVASAFSCLKCGITVSERNAHQTRYNGSDLHDIISKMHKTKDSQKSPTNGKWESGLTNRVS